MSWQAAPAYLVGARLMLGSVIAALGSVTGSISRVGRRVWGSWGLGQVPHNRDRSGPGHFSSASTQTFPAAPPCPVPPSPTPQRRRRRGGAGEPLGATVARAGRRFQPASPATPRSCRARDARAADCAHGTRQASAPSVGPAWGRPQGAGPAAGRRHGEATGVRRSREAATRVHVLLCRSLWHSASMLPK